MAILEPSTEQPPMQNDFFEPTASEIPAPPKKRRWKTGLVVLVLIGGASAFAYHHFTKPDVPIAPALENQPKQDLLGDWKRSDYYGDLTLELRDDGSAEMVIDFNYLTSFTTPSKQVKVDIEWKMQDDHLHFHSLRGTPEDTFEFVLKHKGGKRDRDQVLTHLGPNSFTTHDADDKSKVKTWTRIPNK